MKKYFLAGLSFVVVLGVCWLHGVDLDTRGPGLGGSVVIALTAAIVSFAAGAVGEIGDTNKP